MQNNQNRKTDMPVVKKHGIIDCIIKNAIFNKQPSSTIHNIPGTHKYLTREEEQYERK